MTASPRLAMDAPPDSPPVISVDGLTKRYKDKVVVDGLSFAIPAGRVTGFLGPNGSGKTTTIRMIFDLVRPTAGIALVEGQPVTKMAAPAAFAGIAIDGAGAHPRRSARNHLRIIAAERRVPTRRIDEVLETVELTDDADRRVGGYSMGMRQRLDLAAALLAEPQLLVLDEPANGLDPAGIRWLRGFLRSFAERGGTVFVSSHQLAELSQLADEVVVINHGRLVAHTTVAALTSSHVVAVRSPDLTVLSAAVEAAGGIVQVIDREHAEITDVPVEDVGRIAASSGAVLYELTPRSSSLEEVFLQMTREGELS